MLRPSPTQHAAELAVGTILKGNDGNNWIVKKSGTSHRWVKLTGYKTYFTHHNGERPFLVFIKKNVHVLIYKKPDDVDFGDDWDNQKWYSVFVHEFQPLHDMVARGFVYFGNKLWKVIDAKTHLYEHTLLKVIVCCSKQDRVNTRMSAREYTSSDAMMSLISFILQSETMTFHIRLPLEHRKNISCWIKNVSRSANVRNCCHQRQTQLTDMDIIMVIWVPLRSNALP